MASRIARWASTFAALAAVVDPRDALRRFAAAGYLARRDAERVAALLMVPELPGTPLAMRHFLHDSAELWPTAAVWLGSRAARQRGWAAWQAWLASLVELLETEGNDLLDPPVLVRGEEVKSLLGLASGPEVGRALARIRAAQIEGRVRSREDALALLRRPP